MQFPKLLKIINLLEKCGNLDMITSKAMSKGLVLNTYLAFNCLYLVHFRFSFRKLKTDKNVFLEKYFLPKRLTLSALRDKDAV